MKKNLGKYDRVVRLLIFAITLVLFFTDLIVGTLGYVLMAAGGILAITSFINFCPIYAALGIKTRKSK